MNEDQMATLREMARMATEIKASGDEAQERLVQALYAYRDSLCWLWEVREPKGWTAVCMAISIAATTEVLAYELQMQMPVKFELKFDETDSTKVASLKRRLAELGR